MFIPKQFRITDVNEIWDFVQQNSFGTLVTIEQGKPIATHVPMQLHKRNEDSYITGHLAFANSQWKTLESAEEQVLVMFQGPHAYISSSWYDHENVSTWNYQSVHMYGTARIMNEKELEQDLILLMKKYEQFRENAVLWENLSSKTKRQIKGIVGFEIKVEEVQAAYKLSQNRNEVDYRNIIENLQLEDNVHAKQLAEVMEDRWSTKRRDG